MSINITAYHLTTLVNAQQIMKYGFKEDYIKSFGNGYGFQCLKDIQHYSPYERKTECQLKVLYLNCNLLTDTKEIEDSQEKIREAPDKLEIKIAKSEAKRLICEGYNAYPFRAANNREAYLFLKPPRPIRIYGFIEDIKKAVEIQAQDFSNWLITVCINRKGYQFGEIPVCYDIGNKAANTPKLFLDIDNTNATVTDTVMGKIYKFSFDHKDLLKDDNYLIGTLLVKYNMEFKL